MTVGRSGFLASPSRKTYWLILLPCGVEQAATCPHGFPSECEG